MNNLNYCRPTNDGTGYIYAPVILPPNPHEPTEAEYNAAGWYRKAFAPPSPPEGKAVASTRYEVEDNRVVAVYEYDDAPPPPPRTFSKLKLVAALIEAGVWAQVKAYVEEVGIYDLFLAAQDFREDNEFFASNLALLKQQLGWTDEQVEAILAASEADA